MEVIILESFFHMSLGLSCWPPRTLNITPNGSPLECLLRRLRISRLLICKTILGILQLQKKGFHGKRWIPLHSNHSCENQSIAFKIEIKELMLRCLFTCLKSFQVSKMRTVSQFAFSLYLSVPFIFSESKNKKCETVESILLYRSADRYGRNS